MNTEHIDIGLARYSDWAFTSRCGCWSRRCCCWPELAYSRGRKADQRELVNAGRRGRRQRPARSHRRRGAVPPTNASACPASHWCTSGWLR